MTPDELLALADAATPGPWWWDSYATVYRPESAGDPAIAKVSTGRDGTEYVAEGTHNARLIALAPSLARDHAALLKWAERAADVLRDPWETVWTVDEAEPERGEQPTIRRKDVSALLAEFNVLREGS